MPRPIHVASCTALLAMAAGCAVSPFAGHHTRDGQLAVLLPGQATRLDDGSTLQFTGVPEDSRCPPDVQCIWAGDARLSLHWHAPGAVPREVQLHTNTAVGPDHATLGTRTVTLEFLGHVTHRAHLRIRRTP